MADWVPYYNNCDSCGKPYPWRAAAVDQTRKELAELAEVEDWNQAVSDRASELLGDIAGDKVSASGVTTAIRWMEQRGAVGVGRLVLWAVKAIGSEALGKALGL